MRLYVTSKERVLAYVEDKSTFCKNIKCVLFEDKKLCNHREKLLQGETKEVILVVKGEIEDLGMLGHSLCGKLRSFHSCRGPKVIVLFTSGWNNNL